MDTTALSLIIGGVSFILPHLGITGVTDNALVVTVTTVITLVSGIVAYVHNKVSKNLTVVGFKKV